MSIFNSNSDATEQANSTMQSAAVQTFNYPYLSFISNSASGSSAKELTNKILQHNMLIGGSSFSAKDHHIYLNIYTKSGDIKHAWKTSDLQKIYNKISNGSRYKIYVTDCSSYPSGYYNGYLACISIREL